MPSRCVRRAVLGLVDADVGELGVESAAVGVGGAAGYVALLDEPVDQAGAAAAAEQHAVGDVGHAHAALGGVGDGT